MLTQRFQIDTRLSELQIRGARVSLEIENPTVSESVDMTVTPGSFRFYKPKNSELSVDFSAIRNELGFMSPVYAISYYKDKSKSKASQNISKTVRNGLQALVDPQGAMISRAKSSAVVSPGVEIAALPKNRPQIRFSRPGVQTVDHVPVNIDVKTDVRFSVDVQKSDVEVDLATKGGLSIRLVPMKIPGRMIDLKT